MSGSNQTSHKKKSNRLALLDNSEIIDSDAKLLRTKRTLIIRFGIEDELKEAPKGSLLRRLSEKDLQLVGVEPQEEFNAIIKKGLIGYYFFERNVALPYMVRFNVKGRLVRHIQRLLVRITMIRWC